MVNYLIHSAKGTTWKKGHKYVNKVGNRYVYAKDKYTERADKLRKFNDEFPDPLIDFFKKAVNRKIDDKNNLYKFAHDAGKSYVEFYVNTKQTIKQLDNELDNKANDFKELNEKILYNKR